MVSRRDFLRVGSLGVVGLSVAEQAARAEAAGAFGHRRCILLLMTGGPSQLETWDPKPEAPGAIRGPLRAIPTAVPGVCFSEGLPRLAERADRFAVLRTLCHDAAPIHETGLQLLQTGRLSSRGSLFPSFGSVVAEAMPPERDRPAYVILPGPLEETGVRISRGQGPGFLGSECDPLAVDGKLPDVLRRPATASDGAALPLLDDDVFAGEPDAVRRGYGDSRFGRLCCRARQLVERDVRVVTVNLFDRLQDTLSWDAHAAPPGAPATLLDYRDRLCPEFDRAVACLIDELAARGLLEDTLVVATGEMGRAPRLNSSGGRDHWTQAWSALVAGGTTPGGLVLGATDAHAAVPTERPISLPELTATIYRHLGIDPGSLMSTDDGRQLPLVNAKPIAELGG